MALWQLPSHREDYPFSYFGMYKARIYPGPYQTFEFQVFKNGVDVSHQKKFDPYTVFLQLYKIFLKKDSAKNRDVHDEGLDSLGKINLEDYERFRNFVTKELIKRYLKKKEDRVSIKVRYVSWEHLDYSTFKTPTVDRVIFEEEFSGEFL